MTTPSESNAGKGRVGRETSEAVGGLGAHIRALRRRRRLSLRALAAAVEVTPSLISQIERGKTNPSVASLYAIAAALDAPVDALFGGRGIGESAPTTAGALRAERGDLWGEVSVEGEAEQRVSSGGEQRPGLPVVRGGSRRRIDIDGYGGQIFWELLTPEPEARVDFIEIIYEPGASSAPSLMRHAGREYGMVLQGELSVTLGFEETILGAGDSIGFASSTPHRFENRGAVPMRAIWLVVREDGSR